jgi:putative DNA primase/helicase
LETREALSRFAYKLERSGALHNVLTLARDFKPIADDGKGWDRDPWLLGVPNGVIDLQTGALRNGLPADRITMAAGVPFDPDAAAPRWERFVDEVLVDPDVVGFIRRAIGYSLTGITTEQVLLLLHGTGANGKGSFSNTIKRVAGDYGWNLPFATIELKDRAAIPNDLAALMARRFVTASETNDGTRLNESRVKALTGCDPVTARFLHGEFFTFEPVAKFWLSVNHKPVVRDDSFGFWRRLRLVPFTQTFPVNPDLWRELAEELPGILAWCVRGCLEWQRLGLQPPVAVLQATRDYEADSDVIGGFLADACEQVPAAEVRATELFDHYKRWADRQGLGDRERLSCTSFGRKVSERFEKQRDRDGVLYRGIARRSEAL